MMRDELESIKDGDGQSSFSTDVPPRAERSLDIAPDFDVIQDSERKHSKSIRRISCFGQDEMDAGPSVEEEQRSEESKVTEFFLYNMAHKRRGVFVIFNQKVFEIKKAKERTGTDVDRENLLETARQLGFKAISHDNLTKKEVIKTIENYASTDYSDCDCFACAVLTHGEVGDVLYAKDGEYSVNDLLSPIRNNQSLIGKPKLFFIQACRGNDLDHGLQKADEVDAAITIEDNYCSIPAEADFFIGYCTVEGYYAWRNGENGSWFIQALCFCLKKYGESMELLRIMTWVNRMVAYDFESSVINQKYDKKKQMPSVVSRLTADVYFRSSETVMDTAETVDGIVKAAKKITIGSNEVEDDREVLLKREFLETKLELAKILEQKAEVQLRKQDLQQKLIEREIARLK